VSGYPWEVSAARTGQPRPVLLWGTGRQGELALEQFGATIDFAGVIHNLPMPAGGSWKGLSRLTPRDALVEGPPRPFVIVATMFVEAVTPELERHGFVHGPDWCTVEEAMAAACPPAMAGQLAAWRTRVDAGRPLTFRDLAGFDDEFWLWLNLRGADDALSGGLVAPLPEPDVQRNLTGTAGGASLIHGFNQFRLMRGLAERAGLDLSRARQIVDFGCGYGRIVRFFTKDAPDARVVGLDIEESLVAWCRAQLRFGDWQIVPSLPPTSLPAGESSLVIAFSVFTHLSEESQAAWLAEIDRWLEPGGVAVVTLWTHPSRSRQYHEPHFPDYASLTADVDAGRFCYSNLRYGATSTYGEAFVPRAHVDRVWTKWFDVEEWLADHPHSPTQTHVALRKRAPAGTKPGSTI
jgi:SAM-dependent methyltransferase